MKKIRSFIIIAFFILGISGCAARQAPVAASAAPVQLKIVSSYGGDDGNRAHYEAILEQYQKDTGNLVINDSAASDETWKTKVLADFATDSEADVVYYFTSADGNPLVKGGKVVPLDTIRAEYPEYASNINPDVLEELASPLDGKIYGVPTVGYWEGLFINVNTFNAYHIKEPENWEELLHAVSVFRANGVTPIAAALSEVPHYWFEYLTYNYDGPENHLTSVPTADKPSYSWRMGLESFRSLYDLGAFPYNTNSITNADAVRMFQNKTAAMLLDGSWGVATLTDQTNVKLIPFPTIEGGPRKLTDRIGGFSMGFMITTKAWNDPAKRDAAIQLVEALTSDDAIRKFGSGGAAIPIADAPTLGETNLLKSIDEVRETSTAFVGAVQDTVKKEARETLFQRIPLIVTGEMSVDSALAEFVVNNE